MFPPPIAFKLVLVVVKSLGCEWFSCSYTHGHSFIFAISAGSRSEQISCLSPSGRQTALACCYFRMELQGGRRFSIPPSKASILCLKKGSGRYSVSLQLTDIFSFYFSHHRKQIFALDLVKGGFSFLPTMAVNISSQSRVRSQTKVNFWPLPRNQLTFILFQKTIWHVSTFVPQQQLVTTLHSCVAWVIAALASLSINSSISTFPQTLPH